MFILKLAVLTCAFYLLVAVILEAVFLAIVHWKGGVAWAFYNWTGIAVVVSFWGVIWLASFLLAFRIVFPNVWARVIG